MKKITMSQRRKETIILSPKLRGFEHMVKSAATMLARGVSQEEVERSFSQLGFDPHAITELVSAAKQMRQDKE